MLLLLLCELYSYAKKKLSGVSKEIATDLLQYWDVYYIIYYRVIRKVNKGGDI